MIPPTRTRLDSALLMRSSLFAIHDERVPELAIAPPKSDRANVSTRMYPMIGSDWRFPTVWTYQLRNRLTMLTNPTTAAIKPNLKRLFSACCMLRYKDTNSRGSFTPRHGSFDINVSSWRLFGQSQTTGFYTVLHPDRGSWWKPLGSKLFGGKSELPKELENYLTGIRESISELDDRVRGIDDSVKEFSSKIQSLPTQRSEISQESVNRIQTMLQRVDTLSAALSAVQDYEVRVMSIQEGLQNLIDVLGKERETVRKDVDKLAQEREEFGRLRDELATWRREIQEKEQAFQSLKENMDKLESQKSDLEARIKELSNGYLRKLGQSSDQLDDQIKKLDRSFKFRELRLERLVRKEKELADAVVRLQEREKKAHEAEEKLSEASAELANLEKKRDLVRSEIADLEKTRNRLEKIVREMREAVLKP